MYALTGSPLLAWPLFLAAHLAVAYGLARAWSKRDSRKWSEVGRSETRTERTYRLQIVASMVSLVLAFAELFACDVLKVRMTAPEGVLVRAVAGVSVLAITITTAGYYGYRDGRRDGGNSRN